MEFVYERALIKQALEQSIGSDSEAIDVAIRDAVRNAGKGYRALTTMGVADAYGADPRVSVYSAVPIELGHVASLISDDISDGSEERRGKPSCWKKHGKLIANMAVHKLIVHVNNAAMDATQDLALNKRIQRIINRAGCVAINGQIKDLSYVSSVPIETALKIAEEKTASFFSAAALVGGISVGAPENHLEHWNCFGRNLGTAFQIKDDIYDIVGNPKSGGKPVNVDAGKPSVARIAGVEEAMKLQEQYLSYARDILGKLPVKTSKLETMIKEMFLAG